VIYIFFFLALLAFTILYFKYRKEAAENKLLLKVIDRIKYYASEELETIHKLSDSIKNKEEQYKYIESSFDLLHEKIKQTKDEGEAKSQFLSTMSHEIRTPLNGIIGFTKLLKDMGATKDQEEFLTMIEKSSHRLIAIVNDVLDLSKMNADKMEIEDVPFDLIETIESTTASLVQQAEQKDIEYAVFIDPSLDRYFLGDGTKLSQILTNLIGNAIKFTDAYGKINISVLNIENNSDKTEMIFEVQDDGIGLTPAQQENIFEAFSQASSSTSRKYGGTGLGLTISSKMVTLMGGALEVESKENEGATFFFTLNLRKDQEKKKDLPEVPNFSDLSVGLALPSKSIKRQLDINLKKYIRYFGARFKLYYYDELFEKQNVKTLPDIMIFDHHYARLPGELEACALLECKSVLLTSANLRSRIDSENQIFSDIILSPVNISKALRILENSLVEEEIQEENLQNDEDDTLYKNLHALVADDNSINRKLIRIILESLGLKVTLVENGEEALAAYKKDTYNIVFYNIVFMDIQMPVMDGVEASQAIVAYEKEADLIHVPVIALTADALPGDREKYISEGMDDYATKPLDIDALTKIILTHCDPANNKQKQSQIK
jgi:signal transduction histidine kinase/CheY-like chemotaxis protein